jgi:Tol biopolymer transport system component
VTGLLVAALAAVTLTGHGSVTARPRGPWILLTSNRDGHLRAYSVRADGSRLTPLLARGQTLVPGAVSRDGSTIVYGESDTSRASGIYVSRADGTGLHRVVGKEAGGGTLSPDGRWLGFTKKTPGIWIVRVDGRGARRLTRRNDSAPAWSPDGKRLAFVRAHGEFAGTLVVRPLRGRERVLTWGEFDGVGWSPDGRWIAYAITKEDPLIHDELWVVRPNGTRRHRLARDVSDLGEFAWSSDGRRLAYAVGYGNGIAITGLDGRRRRLAFPRLSIENLAWLPGGRLVLSSGYGQLWIVGLDGHGLRRLTSAGMNGLSGWTRRAPARRPAAPLPKTERAVGRRTLSLRAPVLGMAANGARVALVVGKSAIDCDHVAVWTPADGPVARPVPMPCLDRTVLRPVALAGRLVAWKESTCCAPTTEAGVVRAPLSRLDPPWSSVSETSIEEGRAGTSTGGPIGDGGLLVFTVRSYSQAGIVVTTTLWRLGGRGRCPTVNSLTLGCVAVLKARGELDLLAVDAGRIVVGTQSGIEIVGVGGRVLRRFDATWNAAALSGPRLAVETPEGVDVYDAGSGRLVLRFRGPKGLQDLESGILVTASGGTVTLRRLEDGRRTTFQVTGKARAQLERPGLFLAGARRVTFTPMREILRRLRR